MKKLDRAAERDVPTVTYSRDDADVVVIVGSGAGGGTLANELSQQGVKVILLEAGPRFDVRDFVNDEWVMWDRFTWKDKRSATGRSPVARKLPRGANLALQRSRGDDLALGSRVPKAGALRV